MPDYYQKGQVSWNEKKIKSSLKNFLDVYQKRPFDYNEGGMNAPHMLATWFILREIRPEVVIESGVWKGYGTWLIKQALGDKVNIYSNDPNPHYRELNFDGVEYSTDDFNSVKWSNIHKGRPTLAFFDDHQNAFERIKHCIENGVKHLIFEDNYPPGVGGDCYSPKMIYSGVGFSPKDSGIRDMNRSLKGRIRSLLGLRNYQYLHFEKPLKKIDPNNEDFQFFKDVVDIYYEFPPVFIAKKTRWGNDWLKRFPKPDALLSNDELNEETLIFKEQATSYTWLCYIKLK